MDASQSPSVRGEFDGGTDDCFAARAGTLSRWRRYVGCLIGWLWTLGIRAGMVCLGRLNQGGPGRDEGAGHLCPERLAIVNTLDPVASSIWPAVERAWPNLHWNRVVFGHGAFHQVAVLGTSAVVRLSLGDGHGARARSEHQNLTTLEGMGLPFRIPTALSQPHSAPSWSAQVSSFVPGEHRSNLSWEETRGPLEFLLSGLREAARPPGALRSVRQWCGGLQWPAVVDRIIQPLDRAVRTAAGRVVSMVLEEEAGVETSLVHGDFGLHNILWKADQLSGVIDLDNACIGDPALDLAPLIGTFGSARVADIADRETIARARVHRASLPLQVAAAAELINDSKLKDFALSNFQKRLAAGTLHDPHQI